MQKIIILSIITIISLCVYSQKGQIDGFKNFKFNSMLSDYPDFNFKVHKELGYNQKYLTCHKVLNIPANLKVGENTVIGIYLYCYNNQIIRIDVEFNRFHYEDLERMFGAPNKEKHWCSENRSNGQERAEWEIPNSIISYYHSWYTKEISSVEYSFRLENKMPTFNLPIDDYKLSFKVRNYDNVIKTANEKETNKTLNDFNTPI